MKERIRKLWEGFEWKRFLKFGLIGVLNTLVDFAVFWILDEHVIGAGPTVVLAGRALSAGPYLSNAISYTVANIHSFLWNKFWTFGKKERTTRREVGRYLVTSAGYLLLSSACLAVFMPLLRTAFFARFVPEDWVARCAKVPTACVTILYNYFMNKFWVFR